METVPDEECLPVWVVQLQFVLAAEPWPPCFVTLMHVFLFVCFLLDPIFAVLILPSKAQYSYFGWPVYDTGTTLESALCGTPTYSRNRQTMEIGTGDTSALLIWSSTDGVLPLILVKTYWFFSLGANAAWILVVPHRSLAFVDGWAFLAALLQGCAELLQGGNLAAGVVCTPVCHSKGLCGQTPSGSFPGIKQMLLHSASLKLTSKNKSGRTTMTKYYEACPACHDVLLFFFFLCKRRDSSQAFFVFHPTAKPTNKQTKSKSNKQTKTNQPSSIKQWTSEQYIYSREEMKIGYSSSHLVYKYGVWNKKPCIFCESSLFLDAYFDCIILKQIHYLKMSSTLFEDVIFLHWPQGVDFSPKYPVWHGFTGAARRLGADMMVCLGSRDSVLCGSSAPLKVLSSD